MALQLCPMRMTTKVGFGLWQTPHDLLGGAAGSELDSEGSNVDISEVKLKWMNWKWLWVAAFWCHMPLGWHEVFNSLLQRRMKICRSGRPGTCLGVCENVLVAVCKSFTSRCWASWTLWQTSRWNPFLMESLPEWLQILLRLKLKPKRKLLPVASILDFINPWYIPLLCKTAIFKHDFMILYLCMLSARPKTSKEIAEASVGRFVVATYRPLPRRQPPPPPPPRRRMVAFAEMWYGVQALKQVWMILQWNERFPEFSVRFQSQANYMGIN